MTDVIRRTSRDRDAAPEPVTLFSPGRIGPLHLKNRVIMAPMTTRKADAEGYVTDSAIAYYKARAERGVGLITVEMAAPERAGKHRNFELGLYDDRFLPGLTALADVIHAAGAKAAIQIGHGGGHTRMDIAGVTPIAPSAIPHSVQEGHTEIIVPEEMTLERIAQTRDAFAEAARRAARAGFDAVEIHGAHGYLLSQFMTPEENRRTDAYGGSLRNRARFALEITAAVKAAVPQLAVVFRMNGDDYFPGGIAIDELEQIAVWAVEAGADAIHVTGGHYRSKPTAAIMIPPMAAGTTPFLKFAERIKQLVDVPVVAVGRFSDPALAKAAIADGKADFIALGRPLLADADWVVKAERGAPVRRCLSCNSCVDGMRAGNELQCIVNPLAGRELLYASNQPLRKGQRIAVIGAGPAGLTYASHAAADNDVTVFERDAMLGGAFRLAGHAPLFQGVPATPESLLAYIEALAEACREQGANIVTGADAIADQRLLEGFDHVVVATGASYRGGGGGLIERLLSAGYAKRTPWSRVARNEAVRYWFYYKARRATGLAYAERLSGKAFSVDVIGDAMRPGKSEQAVSSAFAAVFGPPIRSPSGSIR